MVSRSGRSIFVAVGCAIVVVCWGSDAFATGATFTSGYTSFSGGRTAIAIGDFDGDGDNDIATGAGALGDGVYWYENDGGYPASFSFQALLTGVAGRTVALEAADLTGFGSADEFVTATAGQVLIWEDSGGTPSSRSLGTASALGLDPVPGQASVYLALGTDLGYAPVSGTGVVTGGLAAAAETYRSIAVGDLAGGTAYDLVTAGASGVRRHGSISSSGFVIAGGVDAYDVEIADVDGDGDADVLAALNDRLVWYEYDTALYPGPTFFSGPQDISPLNTANLWTDVEAVDFDMDGDLDVVATDAYDAFGFPPPIFDGFVAWFENDGQANPGFTRSNLVSFLAQNPDGSPQTVAAGDLDGDGDLDVAYGAAAMVIPAGGLIGVQENEFTAWRVDGSGVASFREGVGSAVAGGVDINGDGWPDQLIANRCGSNAVSCDSRVDLFLGTADGIEDAPAWVAVGQDENELFGYAATFAGDLNDDGFQDVAISAPRRAVTTCLGSGQAVGEVYVWYGGAPDTGNRSGLGPNGTRGNADEILDTPGSTNTLWDARCENSPGTFCTSISDCVPVGGGACICQPPTLDAFGTAVVAAGDRNGDGVDDLMVGDPGYFSAFCFPQTWNGWGRAYLYGGGPGGPELAETFELDRSAYCGSCPCIGRSFGEYLDAGDIDGNGLSDVALVVAPQFDTLVFLDSDRGESGEWSQRLFDGSVGVAMADVNGDGYDDVITAESNSANVYLGSISGNLSASSWSYSTSSLSGVTAVGDLNGDCHEEIALGSPSQPLAVFYGEASSAGLTSDPLQIMPSWNVAASAGDVARDGFDDLLAGNEVGGRWGADGGAAAVYQGYSSTGGPGDCDGDGADRAADCNDDDPTIFPGGTELCDGLDNDCNGLVDDGPDSDGDGPNDVCDNCPSTPNGPLGGTCVAGDPGLIGTACTVSAQCGGVWSLCSLRQHDADLDGLGDACDPDTLPEPDLRLLLMVGLLFLASVAARRGRQCG